MNTTKLMLTLFVIAVVFRTAHGQIFVEAPRDTSVRKGETAILRCIIRNLQQNHKVYWFRLTTREYITTNRNILDTSQHNRLSVIGSANNGEFHLQIRNTITSDAGVYRCGYAVPGLTFTHRGATLTILREPNPEFPVCEVSPMRPSVGDIASLTCRSEGGIPPVSLTWSAGPQILTDSKESRNVLAVAVSNEHNGLEFICTATSDALIEPRMCSVTLLSIRPDVRIEPPQHTAVVGQPRAVFTCVAFGLPEIVRYEWRFNNEPVVDISRIKISEDGRTLTIKNIVLYDDGTPVHCTVFTTNGLSATSGGSLRAVQATTSPNITPTATNVTTDFFNVTVDIGRGSPPPYVIGIIVAAVLVGQLLIIFVVYVLHRCCNRMMKERRNRRHRPQPVSGETDMDLNVYVAAGQVKPSAPQNNRETGRPTIQEYPVYGDSMGMGEGIYSGTPELQVPANEYTNGGIYDQPHGIPTLDDAGYELPSDDRTNSVFQPPLSQSSAPPLSPVGSAGYDEVPFVEELETPRMPSASQPARVVITSPPPNKAPPRLPADKRTSAAPPSSPYQDLDFERPESKYLSLRHYDDVYTEQALREGARLNGERHNVHHDDDGYVYETATEYDTPPATEKRDYTFMGSNVPPH